MLRTMFHAKIHRATVTQADLHYVGSVTVDQDLLDAADILPGELVSIVDVTNGARLETYTIAGERGSGVLGINGAAAHLVHPGDIVILIAYGQMDDDEARHFQPKVVHVDADNRIVELGIDPADGLLDGLSRPPLSREWNEAQAELSPAWGAGPSWTSPSSGISGRHGLRPERSTRGAHRGRVAEAHRGAGARHVGHGAHPRRGEHHLLLPRHDAARRVSGRGTVVVDGDPHGARQAPAQAGDQ